MVTLFNIEADALWVTIPIALAVYGVVMIIMRYRLVHIIEPATIQLFVLSYAFSGFYPLYAPGDYGWWATFAGAILAVMPLIGLYRRKLAIQPVILEAREVLATSIEFRVLLALGCGVVIWQSLVVIMQTGLTVVPKIAPSLIAKEGGVVAYLSQGATSLLPAFLLLSYRTKWFYVVVFAFLLNALSAVLLASRAGLLWPILLIGAAFFLRQLDHDTVAGRQARSILTIKNVAIGVLGLGSALGLVLTLGSMVSGLPMQFLLAFLLRLSNTFDCIFQVIYFGFLSPHNAPEYSVLISYTQPIHKLLHLNVGQVYNNIGEFIAVNVYHFNIWKDRAAINLALPNSNLVLEFLLSYSLWLGLVLIPIYSTLVVLFLNYAERRRYDGVIFFCVAQYLLMNPVQYITDGNYFVVGAYGLGVVAVSAKVLGYMLFYLRNSMDGQRHVAA